jgi:hypothetical protein
VSLEWRRVENQGPFSSQKKRKSLVHDPMIANQARLRE